MRTEQDVHVPALFLLIYVAVYRVILIALCSKHCMAPCRLFIPVWRGTHVVLMPPGEPFVLRVPALVLFPFCILGLTNSIISKGTRTGEFNR